MDRLKFRLRSLTLDLLAPIHHLNCGSNFELPKKYTSDSKSDIDQLFYCYDICAIPWNRNPPKNTRCTILRIDSTETPSGYSRLKIDGDSTKDKPSYYRRPRMLAKVESGGASLQRIENIGSSGAISYDKVFAICCPYWPVEAEEWRKRKRFHGWPNEKSIARITRGGCHFVSKLRTCDDTEWRFSFSKAELLLIHSWTSVQKTVYRTTRVIKTHISEWCGADGKKSLQTYYFKTLMFWACEEFSPEFWKEENIIICVETLLYRFLRCLQDKYCPSYFIPNCNIMCHLKGKEGFEKESQMLERFLISGEIRYACKVIMGAALDSFSPLPSFEYECLNNISSLFPINEDLNGRFPQYLSQCEWFLPGINYLHAAVEGHLRLMSVDNVASRRETKEYFECLKNFGCSSIRNEDFNSFEYSNPELSFHENFNIIFLRKLTRNSIPIYRRNHRKYFEDSYKLMIEDSLPSSIFCAALAYRANLYFTASQSYKEVFNEFERCGDIIDKAKPEVASDNLAHLASCMPVLMCNSLSQIFDEHLQVILGFATLHRNISSSESSNSSTAYEVCLKLNAWEFLKYLCIQCEHKLSAVPQMTVCSCGSDWDFERPHLSQLRAHGLYSVVILVAALRQSRAYTEAILSPRHFKHVP